MFIHTLNTWLLAQLFHPFTFLLFAYLRYPGEMNIGNGALLLAFFVISFFISIPSFILVRLSFHPISNFGLSPYEKLVLWMIAACVSVGMNYLGILLSFDVGLAPGNFYFVLPAFAAATLSILIRTKQFLEFQSNYTS